MAGILLLLSGGAVMLHSMLKYLRMLKAVYEKRQILQRSGIHRFVRHPLYSGTFIFLIGVFSYRPYLCNLVVAGIIIAYTLAGISLEEKKLISDFGKEYKDYQKQVPGIIPRLLQRKRIVR